MSGNIRSGKIRHIKIKGKYLVIASDALHSFGHKDHFAVEMSQAVGYRLSNENVTFYFKDFPTLELELNKDIVDSTTEILKKVFPTDEASEYKINLFE
jgi:hypothetical protein